jgi:hypothetical protein
MSVEKKTVETKKLTRKSELSVFPIGPTDTYILHASQEPNECVLYDMNERKQKGSIEVTEKCIGFYSNVVTGMTIRSKLHTVLVLMRQEYLMYGFREFVNEDRKHEWIQGGESVTVSTPTRACIVYVYNAEKKQLDRVFSFGGSGAFQEKKVYPTNLSDFLFKNCQQV